MNSDEHGAAKVSDRPVTFEAAMKLGGFELAKQWADRPSWPFPTGRTGRDDLAELAYMAALAAWLRRWLPIHIHSALLAGERPSDVAAATGTCVDETFHQWQEWASGQSELSITNETGISADEYTAVMHQFVRWMTEPGVCAGLAFVREALTLKSH